MYASNEGDEPTAGSARERVLSTAARLFYAHGVRATGIDRIIAEAGVAKMSFYRHFPSKSGLVQAFLDRRHAQWMAWFEAALQRRVAQAGVPRLSMLADVLGEWFAQADFRGCASSIWLPRTARPTAPSARWRSRTSWSCRLSSPGSRAALACPTPTAPPRWRWW